MTVDRILAVAGPVAADSKCIPLAFAFAVAVQLGQPFAVVAVVAVVAAVVAAPVQSSFALERHTRILARYLNYV